MTTIAGALGVNDSQRQKIRTVGENVVFEVASEFVQRVAEDTIRSMEVFVEEQTELYSERYLLPGTGYMSKAGGQEPAPAFKTRGHWDVAYPLYVVHEALSATRRDWAYMTIRELDREIEAKLTRWRNEMRRDLLTRLFKNTTDSFVDRYGTLTIQPLANGDTVLYPPVTGSAVEATDNHYLETGYAVSAISDTNNPAKTIRDELVEHFGEGPDGGNIAMFCNQTIVDKLSALTDFVAVPDQYVRSGANADIPVNLPRVPGVVKGRLSGIWVVQWGWIPANYAYGQDLVADAPLKMRVDESDTGLPQGVLSLVSEEAQHPWESAVWESAYGFGVGNRLNGVALEFGTGGTYTIPTVY